MPISAGCLAHARRLFEEAFSDNARVRVSLEAASGEGEGEDNALFTLDRRLVLKHH